MIIYAVCMLLLIKICHYYKYRIDTLLVYLFTTHTSVIKYLRYYIVYS